MKIDLKQRFVGGDSMSFPFDFFTKVDGNHPLKLYSAMIDPNAPPAPGDAAWTLVSNQAIIDRLKVQNEIPITSVDTTGRTAMWNGQRLTQQGSSHPAILMDFAGKKAASLVENSNIAKWIHSAGLLAPNDINFTEIGINPDGTSYTQIATLDGQWCRVSTSHTDFKAQLLLGLDVVGYARKKYGALPTDGSLAADVEWCRNNVSRIVGNVWATGTCPTGNRVYLVPFLKTINNWTDYLAWGSTHTSASINELSIVYGHSEYFLISSYLCDDGYAYFLVYTDAASTTSSTLLVLSNHGVISNELIENVSKASGSATHGFSGVTKITDNTLICSTPIPNQASGDTIRKYRGINVQKVAESGTDSTTIKITNHGLITGDAVIVETKNFSRITVVDANTLTLDTPVAGATVGDAITYLKYFGTQVAEATVIPSTVFVDYADCEVQFKAPAGYDLLVPENSRMDAGLGNAALLEKDGIAIRSSGYSIAGLAGKTVSNMVTNGSFANGTTGWTPINATISAANNTLSVIGNGTLFAPRVTTDFGAKIVGHKYYIRRKARVTNSDCMAIMTGSNIDITQINNPIINTWYDTSGIITADAIGSTLTIQSNYYDAAVSNGKTMEVQDVMVVDLTATFGAGNEPTQAQCDVMFVNWFNGTVKMLGDIAAEYFTGNSAEMESITAGKAPAYMIELDITNGICNPLFGGSNVALKAAVRTVAIDVWDMASGANAGSVGYSARTCIRSGDSTSWVTRTDINNPNISPTIQKSSNFFEDNANSAWIINSQNKLYILILSSYTSDGTIPSSLSIDFLQIKVVFGKARDTVQPISCVLPQNWAILVRGFSPAWDSTEVNNNYKKVITIYKNNGTEPKYDANYCSSLVYDNNYDCFTVANVYNGALSYVGGREHIFAKNTVYDFMIVKAGTVVTSYILKNNNDILKEAAVVNCLSGPVWIYPLSDINPVSNLSSYQADAFMQDIRILDLAEYGWQNGIPDADAEAILNGTKVGFEFPNLIPLFNDNRWTKHANAVVSADGKTLTLNATADNQNSTVTIPALPNNKYEFDVGTNNAVVTVYEYYNSILLKQDVIRFDIAAGAKTFITSDKTNTICFILSNSIYGVGTFVYSNLDLRLKMQKEV